MIYVCSWCRANDHDLCMGASCECVHEAGNWIAPGRRSALRGGARPRTQSEAHYVLAYQIHQEDRRAADARRG